MKLLLVLAFACLHFTSVVHAKEHLKQMHYIESNSWVFGASVGYGILSNPLHGSDKLALFILPDIRFYGENFSFENLNISYALLEKPSIVIELVSTQNEDGLYFPGKAREGYAAFTGAPPSATLDLYEDELMPVIPTHRSMSYLAGLETRYYGWLNVYASWKKDVSNVHHGSEARVRAIKQTQLANTQLSLEAAAIYKSKRLAHYYYHTSAHDTSNSQLTYNPQAAINYLLKLNVAYPLNENYSLVAFVQKKWLAKEISDSPSVTDSSSYGFFIGVKYVF